MVVSSLSWPRMAATSWMGIPWRISDGTIIQIRQGKPITTKTIDVICELAGCQPGDLISYKPGKKEA